MRSRIAETLGSSSISQRGLVVETEILLTIAEVATAFAGFASLVGVLGQQSSRADPRVLGTRMRAMILFSLLAVAFSLLPFILHRYGLAESLVWRLASGLFAVGFLTVGVWLRSALKRLGGLDLPSRPVAPFVQGVLLACVITGTVLLAMNTVLVTPSLLPAVYLTILGVCLFLSGLPFSLIFFSFLPRIDSE